MISLKNQSGFSHILAIVAAVVVVGGIGAYTVTRIHASNIDCTEHVYRRGSNSSQCVGGLQKMLNLVDKAGMPVDGSFGPITEKGVKTYQKTHDALAVDGVVGKHTWASLCRQNPHASPTIAMEWRDAKVQVHCHPSGVY
ncbi:MAG TPA: peptidoglycan-binding domain-containing protein [Candidatus Saccharimonadales bacterium]|nr:peptidoglycan-binding domain-containing protein [Candidatus Saccharimonadales bacterium]